MAATAGEDDIQDQDNNSSDSVKVTTKKVEQQDTPGESSSNGAMSSSLGGSNILRPSVFSAANHSSAFGATPTFGSSPQKNPFSLRPSVFSAIGSSDKDPGSKKPVVLKASQLESATGPSVSSNTTDSTNSSFSLSPAKLNNPFFKATDDGDTVSSSLSSTPANNEDSSKPAVKVDSSSSNSLPDVKVSFVPLAGTTPRVVGQTAATSSVPSFVFGQNLHERVETHRDSETSDGMVSDANSCDSEVSKTNGTSEMLFTSVIQRELPEKQSEVGSDEKKRKSLSEAAREYEESRAVKRKYEEVAVKTGEEEEINILQINCKLFAFNKDKSTWVERGRGTLRLNDLSVDNKTQSRVVMRVSGSLRVVLNTKIWAEMAVGRPSEKSVRLTAMDSSGEIKVFLVMASVKEIDQLFKALEWRVNNQKKLVSASDKTSETNES
ncbi:ran-binding protein 3-like [Macrosteles quadrilineatus]|uniref:ran-binding protein 3-like n=1 Tax=Macrosteles quadrilineatus TaxID=74068 RepID=UPI0023E0DBC5|nr:ran-binding protein 3-like [Macrosteles quadrilineatus]